MPLYEFVCLECNLEFERLSLKSSEDSVIECPRCGGNQVEMKYSSFASSSDSENCAPSGG